MEAEDKKRMAKRILGEYPQAHQEMLDFIDRYPELAGDAGAVPGALRPDRPGVLLETAASGDRAQRLPRARTQW